MKNKLSTPMQGHPTPPSPHTAHDAVVNHNPIHPLVGKPRSANVISEVFAVNPPQGSTHGRHDISTPMSSNIAPRMPKTKKG